MKDPALKRSAKKELRKKIIRRDKSVCRYCGLLLLTASEITLDHIIPFSRGGLTIKKNLVVSCVSCNLHKADMTPEEAGMELLPLKTIRQLRKSQIKYVILENASVV